ncbi:hypothetical protein BEP19_03515 [Ammoniphilus oxalaticus]|uniref:Uncharacterized protein n=1 Tax=Ammoniphilus oxalaticus TaxID=66863 RepID=A0A419SP16_9BACL|nr:hypothetical protein [Ammoniphilus oxalaticus]RKD26005.1 hypothetical protein BEP19_03515 [Ammoniphilus oxalaticus]
MKTKKGLALVVALVVFIGFSVYFLFVSRPAPFPAHEEILAQLNQLLPEVAVDEIQDVVYVAPRHVFVPFKTKKNDYGMSYWTWRGKWKMDVKNSIGAPRLWMINEKDPASYHFVWNIHPDDDVNMIDLYLIRHRYYSMTYTTKTDQTEHRYEPGIQLKEQVSLETKSYGVLPLSDDWVTVMRMLDQMEAPKPSVFDSFFQRDDLYFGWRAFDETGDESKNLHRSINGSSFVNRNVDQLVRYLNPSDLGLIE